MKTASPALTVPVAPARAVLLELRRQHTLAGGFELREAISHLESAVVLMEILAHRRHGILLTASRETILAAPPCGMCGTALCTWCHPEPPR